jgi:hypothetical protein
MTAFRACYADWKLIKTRSVIQVVMEIPLQDADAAYEVLGGMPAPSQERWFGIAALKGGSPPPSSRRDWRDLSPQQQAGMRCEEAVFMSFLKENHPDNWREALADSAECVRLICGVKSRSELATNHKARVIWKQLDDEYQAWLRVSA